MSRTSEDFNASETTTVIQLGAVPNNTVIYKDNTGTVNSVALGLNGTVLTSAGATSTPIFAVGGDMILASVQSVTGLKTFDTTKLAVKGSSTGSTAIASANASATSYTATLPAKDGTFAMTSDITATPLDTLASSTDVTTNNANTTNHGLALKATAPASGLINVLGIGNAETVYSMKPLFDATSPTTQAFGDAAAVGTATVSARRDHKHAMMANPVSGTINEIAYLATASTIGSLAVATYPSLTEVSYVKGVTSAIQAQFTAKAPLASPALTGTPSAPTATPATNSTQLATTAYVDNAVLGQNYKQACKYATTTVLPTVVYYNGAGNDGIGATLTGFTVGALGVDSASPSVADRILVKNQADNTQNGMYVVTATGSGIAVFVMTRATDFDMTTDIKTGDSVFVTTGTVNASTTWAYNGVTSPTLGTNAITFTQTAGVGTLSSGNGITITGNSIAIDTGVTVDKTTAQTMTNKTLTTPVLTGLPTGTGVASAATVSTLVARDANANIAFNNWIGGYTTTATAAGTTTLTVASANSQYFTGTTTQIVQLPVTSTLTLGHQFMIMNNSTGAVTINSSGSNAIVILPAMTYTIITCILITGTTAASWNTMSVQTVVVSGKVLTINNTLTLSGTDGSTLAIGTGGTLGTGAYATIANYAPLASPTFTGVVTTAGVSHPTVTKTSAYPITTSDYTIRVDTTGGGVTVTLPTAVGNTQVFVIKKIVASNVVTIATTSSQTIDGTTTITLNSQYSSIMVQSNGTNWDIIA